LGSLSGTCAKARRSRGLGRDSDAWQDQTVLPKQVPALVAQERMPCSHGSARLHRATSSLRMTAATVVARPPALMVVRDGAGAHLPTADQLLKGLSWPHSPPIHEAPPARHSADRLCGRATPRAVTLLLRDDPTEDMHARHLFANVHARAPATGC